MQTRTQKWTAAISRRASWIGSAPRSDPARPRRFVKRGRRVVSAALDAVGSPLSRGSGRRLRWARGKGTRTVRALLVERTEPHAVADRYAAAARDPHPGSVLPG